MDSQKQHLLLYNFKRNRAKKLFPKAGQMCMHVRVHFTKNATGVQFSVCVDVQSGCEPVLSLSLIAHSSPDSHGNPKYFGRALLHKKGKKMTKKSKKSEKSFLS